MGGEGARGGGGGTGDATLRVTPLSAKSSSHQTDNTSWKELDGGVRTPITSLI